ncbi:hypothetical protein E0H73_06665 [Kribbella pittospori]|uniref:Nucleotide exchange factor GrpE n=1 Tax=Kribbella pittospori TaxID=722689 RepID=A0A4R0KT10_9ACTN|nr:hypothetical protein [Kribbella pittospori]TCC64103.1 hypothetical protein E0H73_06665 [Kribbella pittospori]
MTWLGVRQWRQHKAFRIEAPRWSGVEYDDLDRYLAELAQTLQPAAPAAADDDAADAALAEAATNLWRAQRKLAQGKQETQGRQAARYLRTCAEALAEAGLTVQDHDGEPFHAGRSVEVLVYSEDPDATAETILETVRPAVYHHDRRIQTAQVIVAVPTASTDLKDSHA